MEIHAIGIDLGKTLFHLVAVDAKVSQSLMEAVHAWLTLASRGENPRP